MNAANWLLTLMILSLDTLAASSFVNIGDDKQMDPIAGRICGIADMNKDGNTDLIVQQSNKLVIYLQTEQAEFKNSTQTIDLGTGEEVFCNVGDFNGDSCPDILVVQQVAEDLDLIDKIKAVFIASKPKRYQAKVYLNQRGNKFIEQQICDDDRKSCKIPTKFIDHPILVDVNGDGITDIFGFELKENNSANNNELTTALYCRAGFKHDDIQTFNFKHCESSFPTPKEIYPGFTPIFTDLDGDLNAEIAFVEMVENTSNGSKRKMVVWKIHESIDSDTFEWKQSDSLTLDFPASSRHLASPVVADVDSDGIQELLIPDCGETDSCQTISSLLCYKYNKSNRLIGWQNIAIDLNKATLHPELEGDSKLVFRVGDFSMNGYPDLIATISQSGGMRVPVVLDNVLDTTATPGNITRKFELSKRPQRIIQKEVQNIQLSAFFDLKEDGNLDILYEFVSKNGPMVNFIKCDDKGDTTFLKVQIFTGAACSSDASDCCETDTEASRRVKIGSGIAWHGACVKINMADSTQGFIDQGMRLSLQCQLPQTSHRNLNNPFVLFGLSRSPNFVDEVHMGAPRVSTTPSNRNQQDYIRQIVPNSRVIVIPPPLSDKVAYWTSRLYVTPSRLIILSFLVMVVMCVILLFLVAILHLRERHQDKKERQAQTHRFHFDAM